MSETKSCGASRREEFKDLNPVLDKYAKVPGSLITILQQAQEIYGYLSVDTINYISEATGIKPAKIYGVATFYAQFRLQPIGKYLIMLCKGTACHVNGADRIEEAVCEYLNIQDGMLRIMPMIIPMRNSFHRIFHTSSVSTSPVASPLIISVAACEPVLPPVPMSIGIYATRQMTAEREFSNLVTIIPVKMYAIMRIMSHGSLLRAWCQTDMSR